MGQTGHITALKMSAEQRERHTVIDNRAIGQNGTDGIANLLIAVSQQVTLVKQSKTLKFRLLIVTS